MRLWTTALIGLAALATTACSYTKPMLHLMDRVPPPQSSDTLVWEVVNRHRLLAGQAEQDRFERDLAAYVTEYRDWFGNEATSGIFPNIRDTDLIHCEVVDGKPSQCMPENYRVNYDPGTNSYRCRDALAPNCLSANEDWITQRRREVRLQFGSVDQMCRWTIDDLIEDGPCQRNIATRVDEPRQVSVARLDDGATGHALVQPGDLLIVALGDSFSAGEGNPHVQWRSGRHPAGWLDARCHRSLMSGPALTAAVLAKTNPHVSVTLLHYGCSGASIADGLASPWAQLETAADIREQYRRFDVEDDDFTRLRVVTTAPDEQDVPLSQVDQALADLTVEGQVVQPDLILLSIGGNDIGFAGIVSALAAQGSTLPDLAVAPEGPVDRRSYASIDQTSWVQSTRDVPCVGLTHLECLAQRVQDRLGSPPHEDDAHTTLASQYDVLATVLTPLISNPGRVFVTHYPNFVMREPNNVPADQAQPRDAVGCNDKPMDGRPGFIPGVLAWIPGLGMEREATSVAETLFLKPLNDSIDQAAGRHGWRTVGTHVENGRTHGYCSHNRYYNTLIDSYWDQGRRYDEGRPIGNAVMLQPDNPFGLAAGSRIVWAADKDCFVLYPQRGDCLPQPDQLPVYELRRTIREGASPEQMIGKPSSLGTTGPVHPNLFGHCNYASAILTSLVRDRADLPYGTTLVEDVSASPAAGLRAGYVCRSDLWGWDLVDGQAASPESDQP